MISVIIPTHNDTKLLLEVIDNLYLGTNKDEYEIIVVNDGGCDTGGRFQPIFFDPFKYPNIAVINNTEQRGVGFSFDRGVERAMGDIIILMGADIIVRRSWLKDVLNAVYEHPNTIGCAVSLGLNGDERDLDKKGINKRYGARLLATLDKDDFPEGSDKIKKNPDHREIMEAKWINEKKSDEPYEIPCALGAFYFTSKSYYNKIGGWDTDPAKDFQGHMRWGHLEPHISLKSWLYGGGVTLFPNIEAGHLFGRITRKNRMQHRSSKPSLAWFNALWISHTMIFDDNLRDKINNFCPPELNLNKAKSYIKKNYDNVLEIKERNKLGFVNSFADICQKFDIKIKP